MGKPKQQTISRFFAPAANSNPNPNPSSPPPKFPPPKISAAVSFSPTTAKRLQTLTSAASPPPSKKPKPSPSQTPPSNPSLHHRFLSKLLDSPAAASSLEPLSSEKPPYTPLEQQVIELQSKYPDVLLMVEVGYRYRFFGSDADAAARVLGIIAHVDHNFLTASIPTFRLAFHVRRLVAAGYKVGVVKQTETAAIKAHGANRMGPFSRGLSALYTRSTIEAAEEIGGGGEEVVAVGQENNYLACVVEKELGVGIGVSERRFEVRVAIVAVEVSTGDVIHGEFNDDSIRSGLEAVLLSLSPAEILLGNPLSTTTEKLLLGYASPSSHVRVEHTTRNCYNDGGALAEVISLYEKIGSNVLVAEDNLEKGSLEKDDNQNSAVEAIMAMPELAIQALALTIHYLKAFGLERILGFSTSFRPISSNFEMTLSANSLHQLEVLANNCNGSTEGSLFQVMNHTRTAFGSRLLKHWVTHPLRDRNSITGRLDAVSEIAESMMCSKVKKGIVLVDENNYTAIGHLGISEVLSSVLTMLGKSSDIQRGISRIFHRTATAAEFICVINAILTSGKQLQKLQVNAESNGLELSSIKSSLIKRLISLASSHATMSHAVKLLSHLSKEAADLGDILNLFISCSDEFPEIFRGRIAVQTANEKLDLLITEYRKQLGMRDLEFISVSGKTHLIELPLDVRVPLSWVKVSSTKKAVRYHPPKVLEALDVLTLAKEELAVACRTTWDKFLLDFGKFYPQFQASVHALANLDCLHSLAILSRNQNYTRPIFVTDEEPTQIQICSGRHPVLELMLGDSFVPNDTNLHSDKEFCQIVTGPNMGGKSCYIRQVALIAVMAQVGSFVPASSAKLHVLDAIYTRMGASDVIQQGTSTFFEELSEASNIIHNCSSRSLVIIDELGRGTSTHDGVAIAYATLHYLLKQKKCMVLFVTHYPKILHIQKEFKGCVGAYHVSYLAAKNPLENSDSKSSSDLEKMDSEEITFLYRIVSGASDKSFGLNVARLAQVPSSCITRAAVMAAKLEAELSKREKSGLRNLVKEAQSEASESIDSYAEVVGTKEKSMAEACQKVMSYITSAVSETEPGSIFCSLNNARELALKAIKA